MKTNKNKIIGMGIIAVLFLISFASAFSVSAPYMENKTLIIPLGQEIRNLEFVLQNSGGTKNIDIQVRITEGVEIVNITDSSDIYTVVPGSKVPVHIEIKIPEDAKKGDIYPIKLGFRTVTEQVGGFGFGTEIGKNFDVVIGEKITGEGISNQWLYIIAGIIILLVLIIRIYNKKRKGKTKR